MTDKPIIASKRDYRRLKTIFKSKVFGGAGLLEYLAYWFRLRRERRELRRLS